MIKRFCDICGKDAVSHLKVEARRPYDETYRRPKAGTTGEELATPEIIVCAAFKVKDHPTGFGGPPDLCPDCANELLAQLRVGQ